MKFKKVVVFGTHNFSKNDCFLAFFGARQVKNAQNQGIELDFNTFFLQKRQNLYFELNSRQNRNLNIFPHEKTIFTNCQRFDESGRFCVGTHLKVTTFLLNTFTWICFCVCKIEDFWWIFEAETRHVVNLFFKDMKFIFDFWNRFWSKSEDVWLRSVVSNAFAMCKTLKTSILFVSKIFNVL